MTEDKGGAVEGFALAGDEVAKFSDKHFKIHALPFYEEMQDLDNRDKTKRKLVVPVTLADGNETEWLANKTSQRVIIAKCGRLLKGWVGYEGEFITKNQVVGKDEKQVIYLKE